MQDDSPVSHAPLTVAVQAEQAHGALCIQHADGTVHTIQL